MELRKQAFIYVMMICILSGILYSDYETAYATTVEEVLSMVGEVAGSAGAAAATGLTLGGAALLTLAVTVLGAGIVVNCKDSNDLTNLLDKCLSNAGGEAQAWWERLKSECVSIKDGATLAADITAGTVDNIFTYVVTGIKSLDIPSSVKIAVKNFIKNYYGYADGIAIGTHSWNSGTKEYSAIQTGISAYNYSFSSTYPYMCILQNISTNLTSSDIKYFMVMSKYKLYLCTDYMNNANKTLYLRADGGIKYAYTTLTDNAFSSYRTDTNDCSYSYGAMCMENCKLIYNNNDLLDMHAESGTGVWKYATDIISKKTVPYDYTIKESDFKYKDGLTHDAEDTTLNLNDHLFGELNKINAKSTDITSDTVIGAVDTADQKAEADYNDVISTNIDDTKVKDNTDIWDKLNDLPNTISTSIESAMEYLFVPDKVAINDMVDHCKAKLEAQTGILTYPMALFIQFTDRVMTVNYNDCIFHIPKIEFMGFILYPGSDYNFTAEINKSDYANLYNAYKIITDAILIIGVVILAAHKGDEMIKGYK